MFRSNFSHLMQIQGQVTGTFLTIILKSGGPYYKVQGKASHAAWVGST